MAWTGRKAREARAWALGRRSGARGTKYAPRRSGWWQQQCAVLRSTYYVARSAHVAAVAVRGAWCMVLGGTKHSRRVGGRGPRAVVARVRSGLHPHYPTTPDIYHTASGTWPYTMLSRPLHKQHKKPRHTAIVPTGRLEFSATRGFNSPPSKYHRAKAFYTSWSDKKCQASKKCSMISRVGPVTNWQC